MKRNNFVLLCIALGIALVLGLLLLGRNNAPVADKNPPQEDAGEAQTGEPQYGGQLVFSVQDSPSTFDFTMQTGDIIAEVMQYVYEGLFELDVKMNPQPHLAESYELSEDGKTYTIALRKNVKFHNGKAMTSADVKACFDRWLKHNNGGKQVAPYVESYKAPDEYTFIIHLKDTYAPLLSIMSAFAGNQKFVIVPQELVEKYDGKLMEEYIGTGPYKFSQWEKDDYVKLVRFDDYVPNPGKASFFAGTKIAYIDEIIFKVVSDVSVRLAGVLSGEYDHVDRVTADQYDSYVDNPDVVPFLIDSYQEVLTFNCAKAPFNDLNARKAVAYGLDCTELGTTMVGNKQFWSANNGSLFSPSTMWYDETAGEGVYNVHDLAKAKEFLAQSSYDGTPVVILNSQSDKLENQGAQTLKQQLEAIGFTVKLALVDTATVYDLCYDPTAWDLHLDYFNNCGPDPQVWSAWAGTNGWITGWNDEHSHEADEIFNKMLHEVNYKQRYALVQEWYDNFWEYLPYVKLFDWSRIDLNSARVKGFQPEYATPLYWNCWLAK